MAIIAIEIEQDNIVRASYWRLRSDLERLGPASALDAHFQEWGRSVADLDFGFFAAQFVDLMEQIIIGFATSGGREICCRQEPTHLTTLLQAAFVNAEDLEFLEEVLEDLQPYEDAETYLEEVPDSWASEHYDVEDVPRHKPISVAHLVSDLESFVRCASDAQIRLLSTSLSGDKVRKALSVERSVQFR